MSRDDMTQYLQPTRYLDYEAPAVRGFVDAALGGARDPVDQAVRVYYAVRDLIRYDPYRARMDPLWFTASHTVTEGAAYCVPKAVLLAAAARGAGIPARLGFADVRNHLSTERLHRLAGSDIYVWHGYVALYLEGKWVKATPAFNLSMCQRFHVLPLDFDGRNDALLHPYNARDELHMEYVLERGLYDDLPFDEIVRDMHARHPLLTRAAAGDFDAEQVFEEDRER